MHGISFSKPRYKELEIWKPDIFDKILLVPGFALLAGHCTNPAVQVHGYLTQIFVSFHLLDFF